MLKKNADEWNMLDELNSTCPFCHMKIKKNDPGIEYSETTRGSRIFFHGACVKEQEKC